MYTVFYCLESGLQSMRFFDSSNELDRWLKDHPELKDVVFDRTRGHIIGIMQKGMPENSVLVIRGLPVRLSPVHSISHYVATDATTV